MAKGKNRDPLWFLVGASVLSVVLASIPLARMVIYPIRLFVTFIHEGGHALAAILTLGQVESLHVYLADGSGTTLTRGGFGPAISSAGYLASTAFGAILLTVGSQTKMAKAALTASAGLILLITVFLAGDWITWGMGIVLTLGLVGLAMISSPNFSHFLLSFLAVQCCLNAFLDLRTLFVISTTTNMHSDAANMAEMTLIPATFWAISWLVISAVALIFALRSYARHL
ncbi:MAG: M50 family metallopeptidase [Acidobacteria bacterium]|nr:M50 family metallopeptidase [Acidobacteriota bacterium]